MAASPVQGEWKQPRASSRGEIAASAPESSLTWCLAHLCKSDSSEMDKRSRVSQWRALVAIRTQHIKGDKAGIARFRTQGGLRPLLDMVKHPDCPRKTLDLALSILANCCTELETRTEVRKLDGITILVEILKRNVTLETVQNRAARALGNLAMDQESSALIHSAGGVPLLLLCVSLSSGPSSPTAAPPSDACPKLECAQSAARALLYLSDTPSNRLSLLTQGSLSALAPLIAPEYPQGLRRAALRTLHELTRGCGLECAREVSRSGVLAQLGAMASGESGKPFEELALKTLANLCSQGCLRPLVGSLGAIQKFTEEVKKDPLKSGVFFKALCLCCKEAVNRAKVKESGGLEVLVGFLSAHQSHPLSRLAILACVDFVFDESAMEQLQELGLVPLLVSRLVELTRGEEPSADKMDVTLSSSGSPTELLPSSCFDSFDFPVPPEGCRREEAREQGLCSSSFLSLRSWLLSEGLISSEGDLLDSSGVDGEWGSLHIPPSSSPQTSSPNLDPQTLSCLKNSSPLTPAAAAASSSRRAAQPSPVSSAPPQLSSPLKVPDPAPSTPQSCSSALTPQSQPCSSLCSPSKTTPVSPSKFSSKRRQRAHSAAALTKVTLDAPPSTPRPAAFHHPYHPEPWTPESPILLLLSRFSHATDPSAALVTAGVMSGLLYYLTQHQDPSGRCLRMLCRISCNPNCLQALVRTGSVALIRHYLCQRGGGGGGGGEGGERQTSRVRAKVQQLGRALLNNLRVQCESGFGSGVLAHVMLSGSESDKMNCALSLPLISSNKSLLKRLLLDSGGLLLALQPLGCEDDEADEDQPADCGKLLSDWLQASPPGPRLHSLYCSLLMGCLSTLMGGSRAALHRKQLLLAPDAAAPPPHKKPRLAELCPYAAATFDLRLLLDDGTQVPASREAVAATQASQYFWALLRGGFGEAQSSADEAISIRDVTVAMLLPALHFLHGCRLRREGEEAGPCPVLDSLVQEGLRSCLKEPEEELTFHKCPLGEAMVGACRFLVTELKMELEDLSVSLLLASSSRSTAGGAEEQAASETESAEENLATRTSELELTSLEAPSEQEPGLMKKLKEKKSCKRLSAASDSKTSKTASGLSPEEPRPKNLAKSPAVRAAAADSSCSSSSSCSSGPALGAEVLAALLPQLYWFSQRYSYPELGRACLSLLLGCQDVPHPFSSSCSSSSCSSSSAGHCLRRLAREADCAEALRQDLIRLATVALS